MKKKWTFQQKRLQKHLFVSEASLSRFAKKMWISRLSSKFIYQYEESFEEKIKNSRDIQEQC